ncbi:MAG: hypothetical protein A3C13_02570 [Candidatus Lloydbacteria bacterium RIFCSPHIGHO2_02_FULL_50_11]|nr:MAG: hypothetical protein A3C13_02570 [Candidatus Lloydbacteria bacterium RIFCSPHIGHO2_02_FULL_50_11]
MAPNQTEFLSTAALLTALRHRAEGLHTKLSSDEARDPLQALLNRLRERPATGEAKAAARVLSHLIRPEANEKFLAADLYLLPGELLALLDLLIDDRISGRYGSAEWQRACRVLESFKA